MVKTCAVQTDLVPDDVGPAGEARLPQPMADYGDGVGAGSHVVRARQHAAEDGCHAEGLEKVAADDHAADQIGLAVGVEAGGDAAPCHQVFETLDLSSRIAS